MHARCVCQCLTPVQLSDVNTGNKKLGLYASKLESTVNESVLSVVFTILMLVRLEEAQAELSDYSRKVTARKNKFVALLLQIT